MEDPFLAFLACANNAAVKYVQHGGYYGFANDIVHEIERTSCHEMFYWGVGIKNCYPTKFPTLEVKKKIIQFTLYYHTMR